jgi:glutamate formiminotransferase/formiminotetrahydrofolate cyclodeaminase
MPPIIECIPNFSDARRPEVIAAIRQAIAEVPGAHVLDLHSDMDHNRSVITFAGAPQAVEEAAFRAIAKAAELIDLEQHRGEHPRIGATDVVPFVPISGVSMQDCVELARRLGQRVGQELGVPVYLYEEAATRPERKNLENLRRGQYEGLKADILTDPQRAPDFGPGHLGKAGATVIGARFPLIAYNVYLTTDDVSVAKKIAKAVRFSSGGLRYVKALGLLVDGRAQVSMNLTNFRETPVARAVEFIRREAGRYGVGVHHCELVGLIPEDALVDAAVWYLQLDQFEPEQILERRLRLALAESDQVSVDSGQTLSPGPQAPTQFLNALAGDSPTPGGGSASAYAGAAAAALVSMVARLTLGKRKYAAVEAQMQAAISQAEALRQELTRAIDEDAAAFNDVIAAYRLPKNSPEEEQARQAAIQAALLEAANVPLKVACRSVDVMALAEVVVSQGNLNAISDGATAAVQARAALTGAGYNVRINAASLKDQDQVSRLLGELSQLEKQAAAHEAAVHRALIERGGMLV